MFKKQFSFLKKRGDDASINSVEDIEPERRGRQYGRDLLTTTTTSSSPQNLTVSAPQRERSPSAFSSISNANSIDRQLNGKIDDDQDPLGLHVVYSPSTEPKADIVFIHGLGGSSRKTWSKNHNPDFFWPLKFLPYEAGINESRISSFGYNANFRAGSGKNQISILDFAKDLLYDLKYGKDEFAPELDDLGMGRRPLIFIVHSMGGLIVKEAYMQGQNDPAYETIVKSISSIIFLSTPHRGTNLAETLNRILSVSFASNPMQYIAELAAGSQTLLKLNEQFRHIAPKLQIVSFYETRPTTMLKKLQVMVLEKDSSVLGYPGEISKPMDADHHGVSKYDSPEDPRYITMRNVLKTLVSKVKPQDTQQVYADVRPVSRVSFEEFLSVDELPDADYNFFRDRWTSGTCTWISKHEAFKGWMQDGHQKPRVLWIHGNAASGKSVLSSYVIDHIVQSGFPCNYFFIRFMDKKKRALSLMLRSLACQLARNIPIYGDKLRQLEAAATDLKTADFRSIWQWLYKQSLFQLDIINPIYLVIDGVDEADSPSSIVRLLSELHLTNVPLRVLVVSRKTHEISSAFQKLGKQVHLETLRTEGNENDFKSYIDSEMEVTGEDSYKDEIRTQLLERAGGNFLWLHMAVRKINKCHTKNAIEDAMKDLPRGMEALYDRMAAAVQSQQSESDRRLGHDILGWASCAQRLLSVEELTDALGNDTLLEIHRTIGDLCGGFVVVDKEEKVAMVHETAREYLMRRTDRERVVAIDKRTTNNKLFKRCIARLTDPRLRSLLNRNQPPALLDYAVSAWFVHLSLSSASDPEVVDTVVKFLRGPHVLTWIYVAASKKDMRSLVVASRYLTDVGSKLRKRYGEESLAQVQALSLIEGWATDLIKVVGKFGSSLIQSPDSIQKLIPAFCPKDSVIYQQFGRKESKAISLSGFTSNDWDDWLARFPWDQGASASCVRAAGSHVLILTNVRKVSHILVYSSTTFEEQGRIIHPERVFDIQISKLGDRLLSYGYRTTKVWDLSTGDCIKTVENPPKRPRPHSIVFLDKVNTIMVAGEDRCTRAFSLDDETPQYGVISRIDEEPVEGTTVNLPTTSAISPDGSMIAYGYRSYPLTVWELDPPMLVGRISMTLSAEDMTVQENTFGEVFQISWHPFNGEIFGLTQTGQLFKWDPYEEEPSMTIQTGADRLCLSRDGSLLATGDAIGTLKLFAVADLSLLYELSSQDAILFISFSIDARRLFDVRGAYGNVWEPDTLIRLADSSEYPDHNSDAQSDSESLNKFSLHTAHSSARVDNVITLAGQSVGPLYCYGTEDGVAVLCEVGIGKIGELERLTSYMSIEHVAWSEDGRLAAVSDLSGKLSVKRITKNGQDRDTWHVSHDFHVVVPPHRGGISQIVFHPSGHKLLACTPSVLYSVDLDSHELSQSPVPSGISNAKWICHPTMSEYLLAFTVHQIQIVGWADLQTLETYHFLPPAMDSSVIVVTSPLLHRRSSIKADENVLGRLISHVDSPNVLLEISHRSSLGHVETQYLLFAVADIQVHSVEIGKDDDGRRELSYTLLPPEVSSRIREPLAFLSRGRLVFLDKDRWICTWRLPSAVPTRPQGGRASEAGVGGIEQYYFLPGDWVTANEARLCTIMADGTLLCPQNGEIGAVQCAKFRK